MSRALCDRQELPRLALPRTTHFAPMTTLNYISIQHNVTWIDSTGGIKYLTALFRILHYVNLKSSLRTVDLREESDRWPDCIRGLIVLFTV